MSGYVYEESTSGAVMDLSMRSGSRTAKNVLQRKHLKYIHHNINTHGKNVTMTVYIDGEAQSTTFTINTATAVMRRIEDIPESWEGYRFDIGLSCSSVTDDDLEIYAPIIMMMVPVGS